MHACTGHGTVPPPILHDFPVGDCAVASPVKGEENCSGSLDEGERQHIIKIGREGRIMLSSNLSEERLPQSGSGSCPVNRHVGEVKPACIRPDPHLAGAFAIRKAYELREHVDDCHTHDGVLLWENQTIKMISFDQSYDSFASSDDDDGRFNWFRYDPEDCTVISASTALYHSTHGEFLHCGPAVPESFDAVKLADCCAARGVNSKFKMTLIEFCCSDESKLSDAYYQRDGIRFVRLTMSTDMTSARGVEYARSVIRDPNSGHVILMSSSPCTFGCSWHRVTRRKKCMDNPETRAKFEAKVAAHGVLHSALMDSLYDLCGELKKVGGDYLHEWGSGNALWKDEKALKIFRLMNTSRVNFDGCALGLKSSSGKPIQKPWAFETTIPQILPAFAAMRCICPDIPNDKKHDRCKGTDAAQSAYYTWPMVDLLHQCFSLRTLELMEAAATPERARAWSLPKYCTLTSAMWLLINPNCPKNW